MAGNVCKFAREVTAYNLGRLKNGDFSKTIKNFPDLYLMELKTRLIKYGFVGCYSSSRFLLLELRVWSRSSNVHHSFLVMCIIIIKLLPTGDK